MISENVEEQNYVPHDRIVHLRNQVSELQQEHKKLIEKLWQVELNLRATGEGNKNDLLHEKKLLLQQIQEKKYQQIIDHMLMSIKTIENALYKECVLD